MPRARCYGPDARGQMDAASVTSGAVAGYFAMWNETALATTTSVRVA